MIEVTPKELMEVMPQCPLARASVFFAPINGALARFNIGENPQRVAAFLAQIAHESGQLRYTSELGSHAYLDKYDTGKLAERLGNTPEDDDDGQRYRGRGLIQLTGRSNYKALSEFFGQDFLVHPELLEQPLFATLSAGWFWHEKALNPLADAGDFEKITRRINGGVNGLEDRLKFYRRAQQVGWLEH